MYEIAGRVQDLSLALATRGSGQDVGRRFRRNRRTLRRNVAETDVSGQDESRIVLKKLNKNNIEKLQELL